MSKNTIKHIGETSIDLDEFTSNQIKFIEWLATPDYEKKIKTQRNLADKMGLTGQTLSRWKRRADLNKAVETRKRERMRADVLPRVLDSLVIRACKISSEEDLSAANKAAELILKWFYGNDFGEAGVNVNVTNKNVQQQASLRNDIPTDPKKAREYLFGRLGNDKGEKGAE